MRRLDYGRIARLVEATGVRTERVQDDHTVQLAEAFHALEAVEQRLWQARDNLATSTWQSRTFDVLHVTSIEQRAVALDRFAEQIHRLLDRRGTLLNMLKQPHIGEHVVVAPADQKLLASTLQDIARSLTCYADDTATARWLQSANLIDSAMTDALAQVTAVVAMYGNYADALSTAGDRLDELAST
ncbi:hypothetical protein THASP1DRAFT_28089 [Thamnocephalis sphaerospora]|uniref:Uncharacterized protein n=1 Tax=Thamnocephalis sphaerospora TaxID=78915 RepID=A0A4P9XVP8_9FUNG|nr:hypothetical protein THASP1DRAFT_28089 [Thamnocephalis sphaerospora]|eukprot:RKP10112.1 hypothetical protein THASP1DRAFT_28089 [Thamnocephalis sphaerospora]